MRHARLEGCSTQRTRVSGLRAACSLRAPPPPRDPERQAAEAEAAQLAEREAALTGRLSPSDFQDAAVTAMAELRDAIAAALACSGGIDRLRATLRRIFPVIDHWNGEPSGG